jgi:uncharacterized protein
MSKGRKRIEPPHHVLDAVRSRDMQRLRTVLVDGEDVDAPEEDGLTPLMEAVLTEQPEAMAVLLDHGADVNRQDAEGWTALHYAARDYVLDAAKLLLERGARVDPQDAFGNTPLLRAVSTAAGRTAMIRLLVEHGADKDLTNNHGHSPESIATDPSLRAALNA